MKATQMAAITKKAIKNKVEDRRAQLFDSLVGKMKSAAEQGLDHIDYIFMDPDEVTQPVIKMLTDNEYDIEHTNMGWRISWIKPTTGAEKFACRFDKAWVGTCKVISDSEYCQEHRLEKCGCGKQATHDCEVTGALVCGRPLCGSCRCHH